MTTSGGMRDASADRSVRISASQAKPDNMWVETAWMVLEAANNLGDEATIEACLGVIDDVSDGELPSQSAMNMIFGFLDIHAH
jgi:hypothetical protein